ncbi:MAG: helix-turn-helix domain-containing protein [Desulfocucumaceae bacterium]
MNEVDEAKTMIIWETADFLQICRNTLMKLVHDGTLPAQKVEGKWQFIKRPILARLESNNVKKEDKI